MRGIGMFFDAEKAWFWAVEVLRMRRWARISGIYDQVVSGEGPEEVAVATQERVWAGSELDHAEKVKVAAVLAGLVEGLGGEKTEILRLYAWGDYADEARLRRALDFQTRMRAKGVRVRLSYRYSYRQLGLLGGIDHKTAAKRVREALAELALAMEKAGLLVVPGVETALFKHEESSLVA